jgi:CPA1 family monovalent cation:H+ antiporter
MDGISEFAPWTLIGYAAAVCGVVVATRLVWLELITHLIRLLYSRAPERIRRGTWRLRLVNSWAGMRGSVSLAAALALPTVTDAGAPFPQRDLLIFLTYAVILFSLVVQGLSLPLLISALGVEDDGAEEREEIAARRSAARAAISRIDALEVEEWTRADTVERMRGLYGYRLRRFDARVGEVEDDGYEERSVAYQRMVHEVIGAQREELVRMRNAGDISDEVRRRIERELDLEESRLEV